MKKIINILLIFLILLPVSVLADIGPKPTINITLINMKDENYLIDLMSDFENRPDDIEKIVDGYSDYKERAIYNYHEGYWYATTLRDFLLFGSVEGNKDYKHTFTYFGVPDEFKVIIELADGTLKISEKIKKTSFNFDVTIDANDMKVVNNSSKTNYLKHFEILVLTILVEVCIALLFKTKKYHIIALVNLITNITLQLLMINVSAFSTSILYFSLIEIIIVFIEGIIYLNILKTNKKKIILYTILANLATAFLTFII